MIADTQPTVQASLPLTATPLITGPGRAPVSCRAVARPASPAGPTHQPARWAMFWIETIVVGFYECVHGNLLRVGSTPRGAR